jgi:hypothetical protein
MVSSTRSRHTERGATLFVVVLALALLSGVGMYSLHTTALAARATGNQREARQTEYLAELGTLSMLSDIAQDPAPFVTQAQNANDDCRANLGYDTTSTVRPSCLQRKSASLAPPTGATLLDSDSLTPHSALSGTFYVEVTDVAPAFWPVMGEQISSDGFQFYMAKFTTTSQLERAGSGGVCKTTDTPASGQHLTRAHIVLGPVRL